MNFKYFLFIQLELAFPDQKACKYVSILSRIPDIPSRFLCFCGLTNQKYRFLFMATFASLIFIFGSLLTRGAYHSVKIPYTFDKNPFFLKKNPSKIRRNPIALKSFGRVFGG